jgi:hypothetical protein
METSKIISDAVRSIPLEIKKEVSFKFAVSDKIDRLMTEKGRLLVKDGDKRIFVRKFNVKPATPGTRPKSQKQG